MPIIYSSTISMICSIWFLNCKSLLCVVKSAICNSLLFKWMCSDLWVLSGDSPVCAIICPTFTHESCQWYGVSGSWHCKILLYFQMNVFWHLNSEWWQIISMIWSIRFLTLQNFIVFLQNLQSLTIYLWNECVQASELWVVRFWCM